MPILLLALALSVLPAMQAGAQEGGGRDALPCLKAAGVMQVRRDGQETQPDPRVALPACRPLLPTASGAPPIVQFAVGRGLMSSGDEREVRAGLVLVQQAADAGLPQAQYRLGVLYENGFFKRMEPCADFNACRARDRAHLAASVRFFGLAAPHYPQAASAMGYAHYYGAHGLRRNLPAAVEHLSRAAAAGIPAAMRLLGPMYINGNGVPRDTVRGLELVALAAQMGDRQSQELMGDYALRGEGIQANRDLAIAWYRKAAQSGSSIAADKLRQLGVREWTAGQVLLAVTIAGIVLMTLTPDGPEGRARAERILRPPDCDYPWLPFDAFSCIHSYSHVIVSR